MLQLVYISTARVEPSREELESILVISRRKNRLAGVTGLLVVGGRRFLQALEGPDDAVIATFERIKADSRHFGIVPLSMSQVEERAFGEWAMAFETGASGGDEAGQAEIVRRLVASVPDKSLRSQFEGFAALHTRAA